jgi:hypothetical protein
MVSEFIYHNTEHQHFPITCNLLMCTNGKLQSSPYIALSKCKGNPQVKTTTARCHQPHLSN